MENLPFKRIEASEKRQRKQKVIHVSGVPLTKKNEDVFALLSFEWGEEYRKIGSRADFDAFKKEIKNGTAKPQAVFVAWGGWHHFYKSFIGSNALAENVFLLDDSLRAYYASNADINFEEISGKDAIMDLKFNTPIFWRC